MKPIQQILILFVLAFGTASLKAEDSPADMNGPEVLAYLHHQIPSTNRNVRIKELVAQLGAERSQERRSAEKELMLIGVSAEGAVRDALKIGDPEVTYRANRILSFFKNNPENFYAALKRLEELKPDNAIVPLLGIAPMCKSTSLKRQLYKTIQVIVKPADENVLKQNAANENSLVRIAAVKGLGQVLKPEEAEAFFTPILGDQDARVQLVATIELINDGHRAKIGHLLTLLDEESADIRMDTVITLRRLSGQNFTYDWSAEKDTRAAGLAAWRNWVKKESPSAELTLPIRFRSKNQMAGRTLMATGSSNKVILLDPSDKKVWEYDCQNAWNAELLPNGNFLIVSYGKKQVEEVTRDKKVVWSMPITSIRAKQLESGNVLISDYAGKRAVEVDRKTKKVIWEHPVPGDCWDVQRLESGNTLIAYAGGVIEVTRAGKKVWESPEVKLAASAERLENGNTIIADYKGNRAIEVTAKGNTVWEFKGKNNVCDVRRLENGNTLVTERLRTVELSPLKKIVWKHEEGHGGGSSRR